MKVAAFVCLSWLSALNIGFYVYQTDSDAQMNYPYAWANLAFGIWLGELAIFMALLALRSK